MQLVENKADKVLVITELYLDNGALNGGVLRNNTMTIPLKFRKTTLNVIDDILDHSENLDECLAAGAHKDTGALARLNKDALVHILNDARIKYPDSKEAAVSLARYVVQAEYQKRNGQVEKSGHTLQHLYDHMRLHNLKFTADDSTIVELEAESSEEEEEMSTPSTPATATQASTPAAKKSAAKSAGSKAAKKSAGKGKGLVKAAEARKKAAADRKTRLDNQIVHLKKTPSEDEAPLQMRQICEVLAKNGRKLVASTLVSKLKGVLKTKQSEMAIWSFYRARLVDNGFVTVEDAR